MPVPPQTAQGHFPVPAHFLHSLAKNPSNLFPVPSHLTQGTIFSPRQPGHSSIGILPSCRPCRRASPFLFSCAPPCCGSPFPSSSGSRAILIAIRRASSAVSILACIDAPLYTLRRLPADPHEADHHDDDDPSESVPEPFRQEAKQD